jgi:hypothetical protein
MTWARVSCELICVRSASVCDRSKQVDRSGACGSQFMTGDRSIIPSPRSENANMSGVEINPTFHRH